MRNNSNTTWNEPLPPPFPLAGLLLEAAHRWPHRCAIDFYGKRFSYRELLALAASMCTALQQLGVRPDVNVGLHLPNTPHFVICFFGVLLAGGRVVSCNPLSGLDELRSQLRDSQAKVLVTAEWLPAFAELAQSDEVRSLDAVITCRLTDFLPAALVESFLKASSRPQSLPANGQRFSRVISNAGCRKTHPMGNLEEEVAVLQYTGATTGEPKAAMLTHANFSAAIHIFSRYRAAIEAVAARAEGSGGRADENGPTRSTTAAPGKVANRRDAAPPASSPAKAPRKVLCAVPLCHIFGLMGVMLPVICGGNEMVLHLRFEAGQVIADIVAKQVNKFAGVPSMLASLANHTAFRTADLSSLSSWTSGGAPLPEDIRRQLEMTRPLSDAYGLTETTGVATLPIGADETWRLGQVGVPAPVTLIEVVDLETGMELLPTGESGEICVTGPQVMRGYWNRPEETREAFRGGRFHTGDIGFIDEHGIVTLTGRKKEMLLIGGHNVYPRSIERAIQEHPDVLDVAVIGMPDPNFGEVAKAFIVLRPGREPFTCNALRTFLGKRLASYELPAAIEFRPELPKTAVGKVSTRALILEELAKASDPWRR